MSPGGDISDSPPTPEADEPEGRPTALPGPAPDRSASAGTSASPRPAARESGLIARSFWWASLGVPLGDVIAVLTVTLLLSAFLCFPLAIFRSAGIGPGTFTLNDGTTVQTQTGAETLRLLQQQRGNLRSARFERVHPFRRDIVALASFIALPVAFAAWTIFQKGAWLRLWFRPRPKAFLLGAAGGGLLMIVGMAYEAAVARLGYPPPDVGAFLRDAFPWPLVLGVGGVLAPVGEELYFRGRLLDLLDARLGRSGAAVVTALAFSAMHGIPVLLPVLFVFGLVLAALRRMSGGLVAPIVAHTLNNLLGLLLLS